MTMFSNEFKNQKLVSLNRLRRWRESVQVSRRVVKPKLVTYIVYGRDIDGGLVYIEVVQQWSNRRLDEALDKLILTEYQRSSIKQVEVVER